MVIPFKRPGWFRMLCIPWSAVEQNKEVEQGFIEEFEARDWDEAFLFAEKKYPEHEFYESSEQEEKEYAEWRKRYDEILKDLKKP